MYGIEEQKGASGWIRFARVSALVSVGLAVLALLVTQPSCTHCPPTAEQVAPDRLRTHVETLAVKHAPRNYKRIGNLDACADYIEHHFKLAGASVSGQAYEVKGKTYRNVIATFGPETDSRIVVGAHYDSCGDTPGADDNASGVAGLIELARLLGRTELRQRVELVAYTLEEPPFFGTANMGSARHAYRLKQENVDVEAMICLEMIGCFSDEKGSQRFPSIFLKPLYPDRGNYIAVIGSFGDGQLVREVKAAMRGATDLPVHSMCAPKGVAGIDFSDHRNYWKTGYTAVMVTDTAFYRNRRYHRVSDTPDTLDYIRMSKVVLGVYEAVVRLASDSD